MVRILTAALALCFTFGGSVAVPVSRIDAGRDSCAIVWIAAEECETRVVVPPPACRNPAAPAQYTTRLIRRAPLHTLFQRPPPTL